MTPPLRALLGGVWTGALDLVFAPVCVACGGPIATAAAERVVCGPCWTRCRPLPAPRCPRCWGPVPAGGEPAPVCRGCEEWPAHVRTVRSAFLLGDTVRALVHALKYRGWEAAAAPMAARMAALDFPADVRSEARLAVPVPTSPARLRERGYNQAALLARGYAERNGLRHLPDLLLRLRAAGTQTALRPTERRANVTRAFAVAPGRAGELRGEHVVLVDDVWTTGATALACARALVDAGARVVSVATFARVVPALER
ncbi:MAG TPA: ComF family protein [Longimicrobiaceae bacterium]|nr:ComF family protein [Longimicrobiaceae bacterium]